MDEITILSRVPMPEKPEDKLKKTAGPRGFARIVGQTQAVQRLKALGDLSVRKGTAAAHILLIGPDGIGKRSLAHAFAEEYGRSVVATNGYAIERVADLHGILTNLAEGDILLIADIDQLAQAVLANLQHVMKDLTLDFVIDKGLHARRLTYRLRPFTCIGTVSVKDRQAVARIAPLFPLTIRLEPYSESELSEIAHTLALSRGFSLTPGAARLVARASDGSPQKVGTLLQFLPVTESREIIEEEAAHILSGLGFRITSRSELRAPTDLMQLSGTEFEVLITTLLGKLGFRTEHTGATGDGGIDIVAYLDRPLIGGKYLVQCKHFAEDAPIGVPTVRDFYGSLMADRSAVKGLFITTSSFTAQAQEFARNLPIELIDGNQLRALLKEQGDEAN